MTKHRILSSYQQSSEDGFELTARSVIDRHHSGGILIKPDASHLSLKVETRNPEVTWTGRLVAGGPEVELPVDLPVRRDVTPLSHRLPGRPGAVVCPEYSDSIATMMKSNRGQAARPPPRPDLDFRRLCHDGE